MKVTNESKEIIRYVTSTENLINGKTAICKNADGSVPVIKGKNGGICDERFLNMITDEPTVNSHIDILSDNFTLEFDISDVDPNIDRIVLLGFDSGGAEYSIRDFDLFFSNNDDVFNNDNLIYSYHCNKAFVKGSRTRNTCDVMITLDKPVNAKRLGFKFLKPNPTDSVARITFIGAYSQSNDLTRNMLKTKTGKNLLKPADIAVSKDDAAVLTDKEAFGESCVRTDEINFSCNVSLESGVFFAAYNGESVLSLNGEAPKTEKVAEDCFIAKWPVTGSGEYTLKALETACISEIGIYDAITEITVTDNILCDDFYGIGGCVLPMAFMDRSVEQGYNEAYWQKEKSRTNLCRPTVIRLWFQPDWFIISKEAYYRHEYDFNSEKMRAVYKYLDMYKESGVEVEMNYGWKVDRENQDWFSIQDVRSKGESAPADLEEFAHSCGEFMYELIVNRGYTNIKYLTFYNEPCSRDVDNPSWIGDFLVIPPLDKTVDGLAREKFYYWYEMAHKVKESIRKKGLADKIKLWGAECAGSNNMQAAWLNAFDKSDDSVIDVFTTHAYNKNDTEIDKMAEAYKKVSRLPVFATEFAASGLGKQWSLSNTQMAMSYIKNGFCGAMLWLLSGITLASPATFSIDSDDCNMWRSPHIRPQGVNSIFYELCLFMRYVPVHSKTYEVTVPPAKALNCFDADKFEWTTRSESDMRSVAFKLPDGEYAVFVEANESGYEKTVKVNIPVKDGTVFYKFTVGDKNDLTAPARLPECCGTFTAKSGFFTDLQSTAYSLTLYTTHKPYEQIICDKDIIELRPGEKYEITYKLYDACRDNVLCSISSGEDIIALNGNSVTVSGNAKANDMASVKVSLENGKNTYDTLLIKVI